MKKAQNGAYYCTDSNGQIYRNKLVKYGNFRYYFGSVSYTHLDVYKRQVFTQTQITESAAECCILFCRLREKDILIFRGNSYLQDAVSYTHLDVYKRQYYKRGVVATAIPEKGTGD